MSNNDAMKSDDDINIWELSLSLLISVRLINSTHLHGVKPIDMMKKIVSYMESHPGERKILDAILMVKYLFGFLFCNFVNRNHCYY